VQRVLILTLVILVIYKKISLLLVAWILHSQGLRIGFRMIQQIWYSERKENFSFSEPFPRYALTAGSLLPLARFLVGAQNE
jgi:hypothetical protein